MRFAVAFARFQVPTTCPSTTIVGRNIPLPPGTIVEPVLLRQLRGAIGVAEHELVEAGQQVHGARRRVRGPVAGSRSRRRPSSVSSSSRGGREARAGIGERQRRPPREVARRHGSVAERVAQSELAQRLVAVEHVAAAGTHSSSSAQASFADCTRTPVCASCPGCARRAVRWSRCPPRVEGGQQRGAGRRAPAGQLARATSCSARTKSSASSPSCRRRPSAARTMRCPVSPSIQPRSSAATRCRVPRIGHERTI